MPRARHRAGRGTPALPGPAPHDEFAMGLPGTDHGVAGPGLPRTLFTFQTGQPLALAESAAADRSIFHFWRCGHPAAGALGLNHPPGTGRFRGDGPARRRFVVRSRLGDDPGRLAPGLRLGEYLQGMAWARSSRPRAAGLRSRAEIPAQPAAGPTRAAAELDHDHQAPSRYLARKLSEMGTGPCHRDGPQRRRPRTPARGAAGTMAAAAQQCHRVRYSLLPDQPAGTRDRAEMGAPSAPRAEGFASRAGRLQGTDAI